MMKKIIFAFALILIGALRLAAQPEMQALPIDPKVRYGKLDNGLTYYIRHNEMPKERAEFFIAQNVGSILEEDNQNGLAHFLEHMAFNGSKNFPGNNLINYLETIGVKFGVNLNAATNFDYTVYNVSDVPVIREGIIDSCLLILHDWSGSLSLEEKDINEERGVIREEMRTYGGANFRILEKLAPQVIPNNQYSKRNVIGTEEIIMNFKPQAIRDYYHKWYRPDLQAIVIVGDIDVDQIEKKIKAVFADIPKPVNPAERVYYEVEDNDQPLVGIATDKEAPYTVVSVLYKHEPIPKEQKATAIGLVMDYFNAVASEMLNVRFKELIEKANSPILYANASNGKFLTTYTEDAWETQAVVKGNLVEDALKMITRETERVNKFGFTDSEYDRARANVLKRYENYFKEKDKTRNVNYAEEYSNHFTKGGYIPGIETEYSIINAMAPKIPLEGVNQYIKSLIEDKNIVILLTAPEKEGVVIPTKEQLLAWFNDTKKEDIKAYEDKVSNEPLMKTLPKGGSIKSESKDAQLGTTSYVLSNGVKVVLKPTTLKDDEILLTATSPGGSSLFPSNDPTNIKLYPNVSMLGGLGSFSKTDLSKVLSGKKASVQTTIDVISEGLSGSSSVKDFETMLQLVYLNFTAPRMDEEAYQSFMESTKSQIESAALNPMSTLMDSIVKTFYSNPERISSLKLTDLKKANYQTIMNWRKDRYKDASDFTFILVGNLNPDSVKPLIAQYLGSLPSINRKESFAQVNMDYRKGVIKNDFNKAMENPKAIIIDLYSGTFTPDLVNKVKMDMLQQVLTIVLLENVREKEGGTYSIQASGQISNYPKGQASLQVYFETDPTKKDYLNEIVHKVIKGVAVEGPRTEDFQKVREFMLKNQQEQEQENGYWSKTITNYYKFNYNGYNNYVTTVNSITPNDIKAMAKSLIDQKNLIEVIMTGVK